MTGCFNTNRMATKAIVNAFFEFGRHNQILVLSIDAPRAFGEPVSLRFPYVLLTGLVQHSFCLSRVWRRPTLWR
jgi:hypothetical protein